MDQGATPIKLADVEDGYARVINASTGATLGRVVRAKCGSTRTGTCWIAKAGTRPGSPLLGSADTRSGAIEIVRARAERVRAWKASQS